MATKQKVAIEIEVIRGGNTKATIGAISQLELELSKLNQEIRKAKKEGDVPLYTKLRGESQQVKTNLKELNRELSIQEKEFRALKFAPGSYNAISAEVSKLKRQFHDLGVEAREGIAGQKLRSRIASLTGDLKKIDAQVGVFTRNVGNYASAFKGLVPILGAVGIGFGVGELVQQTKVAIKTFQDFQQEIKTLQAISGATGEELGALEENARRLGSTTQFTALEVAKLQTNFARIGLTAPEILKATEATVNLAIATTESVEKASEVMGAAINGFGLSADQADRIGDVMTESFNRSALSLEKWAEAQKYAATVAAAANINIEATAASMGILADAGLEGSQIGTVLRRIFSDLSTEGSKLSKVVGFTVKNTDDFTKAMVKLSEAGLDNSKAFELVGRIGQSGLLALAARGKDIAQLTKDFQEAGGAAARTAAIVGDTLAQDMLKAKSAIEGLRINLVSTNNEGLRGSIQGFTSMIDVINRFLKVPISERLEDERIELNNLVTALTFSNNSQEERSRLITEIGAKYPEFLKQVNIETASTEELQTALAKVNEEYGARILLQKLAEDVEEKQIKLQKRAEKTSERTIDLADALRRANILLGESNLTTEAAIAKLEKTARSGLNVKAGEVVALNSEARLLEELKIGRDQVAAAKEKERLAQDGLNRAQEVQTQNLEIIKAQYPELAAAIDEIQKREKAFVKTIDTGDRSVEGLRKRLADLKSELAETPEGSPLFDQLSDEIAQVEGQLGLALKTTGGAAEKLAKGSLAFLQKQLQDLNSELDKTPSTADKFVTIVRKMADVQKSLNEELKRRELLTFDVNDFLGDPKDIDANIEALENALKFHESVKQLRIEAAVVDTDKAEDAIRRLELERISSLQKQLKAGVITEEQYNKERERISQQTDLAILDSRKAAFEVGSVEYLQIVQEIADKEMAINAAKNEAIQTEERERRQAIVDYSLQAANDLANALVQTEANRIQSELDANIKALEEQYAKKLEMAEGNSVLEAELQEELENKKADLEKEAAVRRKELATKEAFIQAALASIKTIAELGFANPLVFVALAAQAIALASQLAIIENTEFAKGGRIKDRGIKAKGGKVAGRSHRQGGEEFVVKSTGQRVNLEGGEGVVNKRSMASQDILSVTGTPAQIVSEVNAYRGFGVAFDQKPIEFKAIRRTFYEVGGPVASQPQFVNPNQILSQEPITVQAEFSDEQISLLANRIAAQTAKETGQAVASGLVTANRLSDRNKFVKNKTGIS